MNSRLDSSPRPFYLEWSAEKEPNQQTTYYSYHLTFMSEDDAKFVHDYLQIKHFPVTISGREVVILPKKDGNFGINAINGYIGVCCDSSFCNELNSFLTQNATNLNPTFFKSSYQHDSNRYLVAYCKYNKLKEGIPSWSKRQTLMRHPLHQTTILWEKFKLFKLFNLFSNPITLPGEIFSTISHFLFSGNKNFTQDVFFIPYIKRFSLNQSDKQTLLEKDSAPKFHATVLKVELPAPGRTQHCTLHLRPLDNTGKNLAEELSRFAEKNEHVQSNEDHTEVTAAIFSRTTYYSYKGNTSIPRPTNETDSFICQIDFASDQDAFEFTQNICLLDQEGNKLEYLIDRDIVTVMPHDPEKLFEISHSQKKELNSALEIAINNLKQILNQNKTAENSKISAALTQLEQKLTAPHANREIYLDAIRNFERACKIDLGTKIGQAVALVIVAAVGFTLTAVIGEAIGVGVGTWSDIASATSKIIDEFVNETIRTITSEALAVLGTALLGTVAAPALTYGIFFKPDETTKAAEKVTSEAKFFAENLPRVIS